METSSVSCMYCEKKFLHRSGLSRHMKNKHSEEKEKIKYLAAICVNQGIKNN